MINRATALIASQLKSIIVRDLLVVSPKVTLMEAIAAMGRGANPSPTAEGHTASQVTTQSTSQAESTSENTSTSTPASAPTSTTEGIPTVPTRCAFVVENGQLVGLLTERDIVQICAQSRPLTELQVQDICSHPAVTLRESALTDVKIAFDLLQQHNLDYLPIVGDDDALVGVVTQASLLRALNPLTLCQLTEQLEDTIAHLEREKNALLEEQASELEQHVAERTAALEKKAKQEQILATVATQIRSSLNIQDILDTTVQEVRSLLNCDRVTI
ncbi:MAG TPA: CBS domain-containing protein, partial [Chroococcidiopsis sp.]